MPRSEEDRREVKGQQVRLDLAIESLSQRIHIANIDQDQSYFRVVYLIVVASTKLKKFQDKVASLEFGLCCGDGLTKPEPNSFYPKANYVTFSNDLQALEACSLLLAEYTRPNKCFCRKPRLLALNM